MALNHKQVKIQAAVTKLDTGVSGWWPQVETAIHELREEVGNLKQQMEKFDKLANPNASPTPASTSSEDQKPPLLPTRPNFIVNLTSAEKWTTGHRHPQSYQGRASGVVRTLVPIPVKGTFTSESTHSMENFDWDGGEFDLGQGDHQYNHRMPKFDFPKFVGSEPQDWCLRCEYYFDVNNIYLELVGISYDHR